MMDVVCDEMAQKSPNKRGSKVPLTLKSTTPIDIPPIFRRTSGQFNAQNLVTYCFVYTNYVKLTIFHHPT